MAPRSTPGQVAWLNHLFEGQTDFRRTPTPAPSQSPASRGAATRRRNTARARAAATPDYTPGMQGDARGKIRTVSGSNPRTVTANRANVISGGRASAARASVPQPPSIVPKGRPIPPIPSAASEAASAASKGSRFMKVFGKIGKIAIPSVARGVAGPVAGAVAAADVIKDVSIQTGISKPQNIIIGPAEVKAAQQYGPKVVSDAKKSGRYPLRAPVRVAPTASKTANTVQQNRLPDAPKAPAKPSRLSDYGAAPKKGGGTFLRRAYYNNRLVSMSKSAYQYPDQALSTSSEMKAATKRFKQTHAWARNAKTAEQKRNLNVAMQYLANRSDRRYFAP